MGGLVFTNFNDVEPGTYVYAKVVSCRGVEGEARFQLYASENKSSSGYSWFWGWKGRITPPSVDVYFTISAPGKLDNVDPYPHTYSDNPDGGTCSSDAEAGKSITSEHIKKWSTKKRGHTKAKAGKRVKVNKTYLKPAGKGMNVTYRWYAGNKVVDKDRSYKVSKKYDGKTLKMKVTISKSGYETRSRTINFGKVGEK